MQRFKAVSAIPSEYMKNVERKKNKEREGGEKRSETCTLQDLCYKTVKITYLTLNCLNIITNAMLCIINMFCAINMSDN